jgi:hypothetical protein
MYVFHILLRVVYVRVPHSVRCCVCTCSTFCYVLCMYAYVCTLHSYVRLIYKRFFGVSLFYNFLQYFPTKALSDVHVKCLSSNVLTHIVTSSLVFMKHEKKIKMCILLKLAYEYFSYLPFIYLHNYLPACVFGYYFFFIYTSVHPVIPPSIYAMSPSYAHTSISPTIYRFI